MTIQGGTITVVELHSRTVMGGIPHSDQSWADFDLLFRRKAYIFVVCGIVFNFADSGKVPSFADGGCGARKTTKIEKEKFIVILRGKMSILITAMFYQLSIVLKL